MKLNSVEPIIDDKNRRKLSSDIEQHRKEILLWRVIRTTQYILTFVILALFFLLQASQCVIKYRTKPTYVDNFISSQMEAEFPVFTICPLTSGYKSDVLLKHGIMTPSDYNHRTNHSWQSSDKTISPDQLFRQATYSIKDLIKKFQVRTLVGESISSELRYNFVANLDKEDEIYNFKEQRHRKFGRCYSASPGKKVNQTLGVYYVKIKLHESVKVYFHHSNQFLDLSGRMGIKVKTGKRTELQVNYAVFKMLEDETEMGYQCSKHPPYDDCMYSRVGSMMKEAAGCTVPWIVNSSICTDAKKANITYWIHYNSITNQAQTCPNPCDFIRINVGPKNEVVLNNTDETPLYIYFQNRALTNRENFLYTTLTLAAEIGGYLGLLLGMSLFTFADLVSSLINRRIKILEKKEKNEVEKILSAEEFINKRMEELKEEVKQRIARIE